MRAPAKRMARDWLEWPFFQHSHRALAERLDMFIGWPVMDAIDHDDVDASCRRLVREMGRAGLLEAGLAPPEADATAIDSRAACLTRETLAWRDGLADFVFAMQGLGSGAIAIAGSPELRAAVLPKTRAGKWLAAFALSETEAGSDVAAMVCSARLDGDSYVIDGEKTWFPMGASPTSIRCSRAPARGRVRGAFPLCRLSRRSRFLHRRPHRRDRAAPARDSALRELPHPLGRPPRGARRRLQNRDADARHLPRFGRRRRGRSRPPGAR